jgi:protein transport protein SEC24
MLKSMSIRDQATFIYPLLYKIHTLAEHPLFGSADENGNVFFPGMARPTTKEFHPNFILLIDTLDKLFLWIGKEVDPSIIQDLLSPEENSPEVFNLLIPLSKKETDLSERLFGILSSRQLQRMLSPDIFIIRQGSSMETHLVPYLVEDVHSPPREPKDMDYTEFLRHIHNMITTKNKT